MRLYEVIHFQPKTMTSNENTFMFPKDSPFYGKSDDLYREIVTHWQSIDKTFLKKNKYDIILYTCNNIIWPFCRVKDRKHFHPAIWNVTQDLLTLGHTYGLNIANRRAPKHPFLSMKYQQIGLYFPVVSYTGGSTKHLQKTTCVQAGIDMEISLMPMPAARTSNQMVLFISLVVPATGMLHWHKLKQDSLTELFLFESSHIILEHNS